MKGFPFHDLNLFVVQFIELVVEAFELAVVVFQILNLFSQGPVYSFYLLLLTQSTHQLSSQPLNLFLQRVV